MKSPRVLLMIGASRASERGLLRGIARYSQFHGPWVFYREAPFYRQPPYHGQPGPARTTMPLNDRSVDGVVAFATTANQARAFIPSGLPAVIVPIEERIPGRCSIVEEPSTVGRMGAEHLLLRGFKRFAFCGFDHMYWSRVRQEGFVRRLSAAGLRAEVYEPARSSPMPWAAELAGVARWLRSLPKPVGLMACNDDRAQQIIEATKITGSRVPDEIAILGVDDDQMVCELAHPPLSSVALNFEEAGYEAAVQLDRQMRGEKAVPHEIYLRPLYIHTRQSTDMLAVEDRIVAESLRFIRAHAAEGLSVQDVVKAGATSRRLLERHFRQAVGMSIHREIQRARIERACRMLVETKWPVSEVAERCGFSSVVHLCVAFKRALRMTPQQHRRAALAGDAGCDGALARLPGADLPDPGRERAAKSKWNGAKSNRPRGFQGGR